MSTPAAPTIFLSGDGSYALPCPPACREVCPYRAGALQLALPEVRRLCRPACRAGLSRSDPVLADRIGACLQAVLKERTA